jgi:nucleoside-diphosphate-sugar epimerase
MKIFLTGATGFVGHHVAKALAAEGADLRLLTRKSSNLANLEGINGETVVGDLSDPASLKSSLAGVDAVVHVAADYRLWIPDPAAMYRANVDGTRELLRLAREAGVKRFVYTSSVATMHFRTDGIVINEDTPVSIKDMVGHYKRSKFLAEQQAIKAAQSCAIAATYAFFEEWITGRMRGKEPRATLEEVRMGRKKMYASSARAQTELGFRILPVYPAMRAAIDWFRANGYAP